MTAPAGFVMAVAALVSDNRVPDFCVPRGPW